MPGFEAGAFNRSAISPSSRSIIFSLDDKSALFDASDQFLGLDLISFVVAGITVEVTVEASVALSLLAFAFVVIIFTIERCPSLGHGIDGGIGILRALFARAPVSD